MGCAASAQASVLQGAVQPPPAPTPQESQVSSGGAVAPATPVTAVSDASPSIATTATTTKTNDSTAVSKEHGNPASIHPPDAGQTQQPTTHSQPAIEPAAGVAQADAVIPPAPTKALPDTTPSAVKTATAADDDGGVLHELAADASERGVPVRWILDVFVKRVEETTKGNQTLGAMSTREVVESVILPLTAKHRCPYAQMVPDTRPPDYFVAHAWDRPVAELFSSLSRRFAVGDEDAVIWIDIFAINQHSSDADSNSRDLMGMLSRVVGRTRQTLLVLDADGECLKRAWCLKELRLAAAAVPLGGVEPHHETGATDADIDGGGAGKLQVLPYCLLDSEDRDRSSIHEALGNIRVQHAKASLPSDASLILSSVTSESGGAPAFNTAVTTAVVQALTQTPDLFEEGSRERSRMQGIAGGIISESASTEAAFGRALPLLTGALEAAEKTGEELSVLRALNGLGTLQVRRSELSVAEPMVVKALEGLKSKLGEKHPETMSALHAVASLYDLQGDHARAAPLFAKSAEQREEALGPTHIDTLSSLYCLSNAYYRLNEIEKAGEVARRVLQGLTTLRGPSHNDTYSAMSSVAVINEAQGNIEEAGSLYKEVLEKREELLGPDHFETLFSAECLAGWHFNQGEHAAAQPLFSRVVEGRKVAPTLGPTHADTLSVMHRLAVSFESTQQTDEAEALYKQMLAAREESLGKDHADTLLAVECLGTLYYNKGDHTSAGPQYARVAESRKAALGADAVETLAAMALLAANHVQLEEFQAAEALYVAVVEGRRAALGGDHADTLSSLHALANLRYSAGNYDAAVEAATEVVKGRESALGTQHADTLMSMYLLALVYEVQSNWAEAEQMHSKTWLLRKLSLGEEHSDTLASLDGLARVRTAKEEHAEAEPLLNESWQLRKAALGETHPDTLSALNLLANCRYSQGNLASAEELFTELYTAHKAAQGASHPDALAAMHSLALTYHSAGNTEMAYACYNEALSKRWEVLGQAHPDSIATMDLYEQLLQEMGMMEKQEGEVAAEGGGGGDGGDGGGGDDGADNAAGGEDDGPPLTFIFHPAAEEGDGEDGAGEKPAPVVFVLNKETDEMVRQSEEEGLAIAAKHGCLDK